MAESSKKKLSKKTKDEAKELSADNSSKESALLDAIANIEKKFGKGSIIKFGEKIDIDIPVIPSGALGVDIALGVGGIPKGRIIEVYGPESSGKTTLALHAVAEAQKLGGIAGYVDAEHALDPVYAKNLGVNINELYISQPDDGEQALEIAESMIKSGAIDIVIIDSVAALVPRAEIEGIMGASHMGVQARLMSQALRKLTGITHKYNCIVIFINQLRDKIGVTYGSAETTTGGRALKFYASIRMDIRRIDTIKSGNDIIGSRTKVKIAKNKVAPPFKTCEFDIMYGKGISKEGDILDIGVSCNLLNRSGTWYSYNETRLGQGREKAKEFLQDHPEMCHEIENGIRKIFGLRILEELKLPENNVKPEDVNDEVEITEEDLRIEELLSNFEAGDIDEDNEEIAF